VNDRITRARIFVERQLNVWRIVLNRRGRVARAERVARVRGRVLRDVRLARRRAF
jgi:hypothetical protein